MICDVHKALIYRTAIITVEKWHIAASTLYNAAYASRSDPLPLLFCDLNWPSSPGYVTYPRCWPLLLSMIFVWWGACPFAFHILAIAVAVSDTKSIF